MVIATRISPLTSSLVIVTHLLHLLERPSAVWRKKPSRSASAFSNPAWTAHSHVTRSPAFTHSKTKFIHSGISFSPLLHRSCLRPTGWFPFITLYLCQLYLTSFRFFYFCRKSVYRFINKLLKSSDSNDSDLDSLCQTLLNLDRIDEDRLEAWIEFAILRHLANQDDRDSPQPESSAGGSPSGAAAIAKPDSVDGDKSPSTPTVAGPTDGISLLQNLTNFAVRKGEADGFALALLKLLLRHLSPAGRGDITPDLVIIMIKLAAVGQGAGHRDLFQATLDWIFKYQQILPTESWAALSQEDLTSPPPELAAFCCLLQYTTDVLYSLNFLSSNENKTSAEASSTNSLLMMETMEGLPCPRSPVSAEVEDWADDMGLEDVESDGDESDEDLLCNKLCTYVQTQKEFMNQVLITFQNL